MHLGANMLETSRKEIRNFANLLRKKLVSAGCHQAYVNSLSDDQILDDYRTCCDCGEEIHSKDQQLRLIIESDTPERAYELLYEIEAPDEQQTETDECLILYNDPEYLDDETCDDCECDEDHITIRAKWAMDGATSLDEAVQMLEDFKQYLIGLKNDGYELEGEVDDDYGFCRRK